MRRSLLTPLLLAACGGGGGGTPIPSLNVAPELVLCRTLRDSPAEGTLRAITRRGLADTRLADAAGAEFDVRVHPDGIGIVFARERRGNDLGSREIYTGVTDGSALERRLTTNDDRDDSPCWNSDGTLILFSSDRGGRRRIWSMTSNGTDLDPLFDDGSEQTDPDAHGGLVAFSRWDPLERAPRRTLWMFDEVAVNAWPVTDGGSGSSTSGVPGDKDPAFSPDGTIVLFTRSTSGVAHRLMRLTVATGAVEPVGDGGGDDRWPRWSPHGDSIFLARSRPNTGLVGLRLCELRADGTEPILLLPDERFEYPGFDALPALAPRTALGTPRTVDIGRATGSLAFGSGTLGSMEHLRDADGVPISILTGHFDGRQVGGLRVVVPLDADDPTTIARVDVFVRASVGRADGDSVVRVTANNPGEGRNDTILERTPGGTGLEDYAFSTQGLHNLDRDGNLTLTVIADLPDGDRTDLAVDQLVVTVTTDA